MNKIHKNINYIWYAVYGSNLQQKHLMQYIKCEDASDVYVENQIYELPYSVYFARQSKKWDNAAIAFLNTEKSGFAYSRIYLISKAQFDRIQYLEGAAYSKIINLGVLDGYQIVTITEEKISEKKAPSEKYLKAIFAGLLETYPTVDPKKLELYLYSRALEVKQLSVLKTLRASEHGMSVSNIAEESHVLGLELKGIIKSLSTINLIKQDQRSIAQGIDRFSFDAVYYCRKKYRQLIDNLIFVYTVMQH